MKTNNLYDQMATVQMKLNAIAKSGIKNSEVDTQKAKLSEQLAEITRQLDLLESA